MAKIYSRGKYTGAQRYRTETLAKNANSRLITGTVTGTLVVGETITQAVSGATAVVATALANGYIDVNTVTGTFNSTNLVTGGTSSATFTPAVTLVDVWDVKGFCQGIDVAASNSGQALTQVTTATANATNKFKMPTYNNGTQIETLKADGWTSIIVEYGG